MITLMGVALTLTAMFGVVFEWWIVIFRCVPLKCVPPDGLLDATIAFNVLAARIGVHVVRVHDVAEVARALRIVNAARAGQQ